MVDTPEDIPTDIDPAVKAAEVLAEAKIAVDALPDDDPTKASTLATIGLGYSNLATPQAAKSLRGDARNRLRREMS